MAAVVIPWRGGCPHREAALAWVVERYEQAGWPVVVGETTGPTWRKAEAVANGLTQTDAQTLIVADADVWCDGLPEALAHLETWAIPHRTVWRLTPEATDTVYQGSGFHRDLPVCERPYKGYEGGGIVAIRRDLYGQVPLDPRFEGWGHEDESWAHALRVTFGPPWRGSAPLWHLWHPPQERPSRRLGSVDSRHLRDRYRRARTPETVARLVAEGRSAWPSNDSASTVRASASS